MQVRTPGKLAEMGMTACSLNQLSTSPCNACCPKHSDRSKPAAHLKHVCVLKDSPVFYFQHNVFLSMLLLSINFTFLEKFRTKSLCFSTYS